MVTAIAAFSNTAVASPVLEELWARPTERLTVQVGVGQLETEFEALSLANTETLNDADDQVDLSGNGLISAPKLNFNLSLNYDLLVMDTGTLSINGNANYQDEQWYSAYHDQYGDGGIRQDAYGLDNGRLDCYANDGSYSVSVWGKNLLDEECHVYALNLQANFGVDEFIAGQPRTYGLDVSVNF